MWYCGGDIHANQKRDAGKRTDGDVVANVDDRAWCDTHDDAEEG